MKYSAIYYLQEAIRQLQENLDSIKERIDNGTREPDEIEQCGKLEILFDDWGNVRQIEFYGLMNKFDKIYNDYGQDVKEN
jgi:hypothetical protein